MSFDNPTNVGVRNVDNLSQTFRLLPNVVGEIGDSWPTLDLSDAVSYALSLFVASADVTLQTVTFGLQWWDRVGPDGEPDFNDPINTVSTFYESVEVALSVTGLRTLLYNNCRGNFLTITLLNKNPGGAGVLSFVSAELTSSSKQVPRPVIQENSDLTDVPYSGLLFSSTANIGSNVLVSGMRSKLATGPLNVSLSAGTGGTNNMRFSLNWGVNQSRGITVVVVPGNDQLLTLLAPSRPLVIGVRNIGAAAQTYAVNVWAAGDF